ncbi:MAG: hypothetical protein KDC16_11880, partial [Saprospiraceae bacterium]|nr:hypothetical protein [Saprospiraceae bacterium]
MGGCLNIEIHQSLNSHGQFISSLKDILNLGLNQRQLAQFVSSVKLHNDGKHCWCEYEKVKVKFQPKQNVDQLEWDIFLYCNQDEYNYVIEFRIQETKIQIYEEDWPYFEIDKTNQILSLMKQIHELNKKALILFIDEASQGILVENLNKEMVDINFLFDLAILPFGLNWSQTNGEYEIIKKVGQNEIWKSKSKYMRK